MRSDRVQKRNSLCRGRLFCEVLAQVLAQVLAPLAPGTTAVARPQEPHLYEDASGSSIAQTTEQFPAGFVLLSHAHPRWLTTTSMLSGGHIQSPAHQRTRQFRVSHRLEKALASSHRECTEP